MADLAAPTWTPDSWKSRPAGRQPTYDDASAVDVAVRKLRSLPPLVTSWEVERLRSLIADAQEGRRFLLQGGDCAETLDDCRSDVIANKLKILLQMSLVLVHGAKRPVIRVGRFAGQYSKPRSSATEVRTVDGGRVELPSYFGDMVNRAAFTPEARRTDPHLMVRAHQHAAMTLNFIRALIDGGFADLHHPEYWDLSFLHEAGLTDELRVRYVDMSRRLADALKFMEALGETSVAEIRRVEFFTSHEALNLLYESAATRSVPRRPRHYNLSTHLPWIGERTRDPGGAHVEYCRGIANPVGVKLGADATAEQAAALVRILNPEREAGKIVLITRMGAAHAAERLPRLIEGVARADVGPVLWVSDPMHGNTTTTAAGIKTRRFEDVLAEVERTFTAHAGAGSRLGGIHVELTGEDVTECVGGAGGLTEADLARNYASVCDPRLNYHQAMELAFLVAERLSNG